MTTFNPNLRINVPTITAQPQSEGLLHAVPTVSASIKSSTDAIVAKPEMHKIGLVGCLGVSTEESSHHPANAGKISADLADALRGINWGAANDMSIETAAESVSENPGSLEQSIVKIAKVKSGPWNTSNIAAFVQAVLRESYMLQSEQLLDFANKVKHCNLQRKGLREHLANLREVKTALGPLTEQEAATTSLNGNMSQSHSQGQAQTPTASAPTPELAQDERIHVQATIDNIKAHQSSNGKTDLENRMLTVDGYKENVLAAIPHMDTQELWHLVHALGGSDFNVAEELDGIWDEIVSAMTPEQLVEMSATQATQETLDACNGTNKVVMSSSINGTTHTSSTPRNLLNDCCDLSRSAANRYQTIRDYAGAELTEYGIPASVGSPASLIIALEELEIFKSSRAEESKLEPVTQEATVSEANTQYTSNPMNGYIDVVTVSESNPNLIATGERINTAAELTDEIDRVEDLLCSVGEDAQMANLNLQNTLQKQQQLLQMMSNISKTLHETAMSIIRKIGS